MLSEYASGDAFILPNQAEEEMLGPDVVVAEAMRLFLRQRQDFARSCGEFLEFISHYGPPNGEDADRCSADGQLRSAADRSSHRRAQVPPLRSSDQNGFACNLSSACCSSVLI